MKDEGASEVLLMACVFRQALIYSMRKGGRDTLIHAHETVTLFPLLWTCLASIAAVANVLPSLAPGISDVHLGLVFTPQMLTWYWSLQNRGEITKSDFTAHALALTATVVLLLTGGHFGSVIAVFVSFVAFAKRSGFPKTRQSFLWLIMLVISLQRALDVPFQVNTWVVAFCEIATMFVMKLRFGRLFSFDKRMDDKVLTGSLELTAQTSDNSLEAQRRSPTMRKGGPLLSFDSVSELSPLPSPPPPSLTRSDSLGARNPLELIRTDSAGPSRPHGSGHRRGVSTQSSGGSWAWGVAVQDFAKSVSPVGSSDEDDDVNDMA